jgi:hypothetical protein
MNVIVIVAADTTDALMTHWPSPFLQLKIPSKPRRDSIADWPCIALGHLSATTESFDGCRISLEHR